MNIGILVYPGVEDLDVATPVAVLSEAGRIERGRGSGRQVVVETIGRTLDTVKTLGGLKLFPHHSLASAPPLDGFVVPGGTGRDVVQGSAEWLSWVRRAAADAQLTAGLSTGAFILAQAGLLAGKRATTHAAWIEDLRRYDSVVRSSRRVEIDGRFLTSGGGSAVMEASVAIVRELLGADLADLVSASLQYAPPKPAGRKGT